MGHLDLRELQTPRTADVESRTRAMMHCRSARAIAGLRRPTSAAKEPSHMPGETCNISLWISRDASMAAKRASKTGGSGRVLLATCTPILLSLWITWSVTPACLLACQTIRAVRHLLRTSGFKEQPKAVVGWNAQAFTNGHAQENSAAQHHEI